MRGRRRRTEFDVDLEKLNIAKMTKKKGISKPCEQRPQGWCVWSAGEHGGRDKLGSPRSLEAGWERAKCRIKVRIYFLSTESQL